MTPHAFFSILLTPGPVALSFTTKREMLLDHPMDGGHIEKQLAFCKDYLLGIANAAGIATAVPLSGSATGANEAAIQTFVPPDGKLLVYSNGIFGDRLAAICTAMRLPHRLLRKGQTQPLLASELSAVLATDRAISHVMVVHCETSSGILNPIRPIADVCHKLGRKLLIDAVSTFGALPIDLSQTPCEALILGANKCLQGPPGLAWVIADEASLRRRKGKARSLTLDLWDQWQHFEAHRAFRFTPPTHVIAAFAQALREHRAEGGQGARLKRYQRNWDCLVGGMRRLGFKTLLPDAAAAPVVATFMPPSAPGYDAITFARRLAQHGFQISLWRATVPDTLRIGCIGDISEAQMAAAVTAIGRVLGEMGRPAPRDHAERRRAG